MHEFIDLKAADGFVCTSYVAHPEGAARGAVVVLQEIFGVNSHIRNVVDGYAAAGYMAMAPAAFQRVKADVEIGYTPDDMAAGFALKKAVEELPAPGVMADIQAAVDHAAQFGKVGVVGYCWGGLLTWRSACMLKGVSAAVAYYGGGVTTEAESARAPQCPVMAHFGELDTHIPMDGVNAFKVAHPDVQVQVYAANHGFNCDQRGAFDASAARVAYSRSLRFFDQYLG
jgi:carboxymethylenebutenolidase